ncbi:MAG: acyltransferase [Acutalibacteraceae bacterium]|nr:acyltransferase [Acutalibacteraceae bacterium]
MVKVKRQSGIELLRIIAMLQIIFLHVSQYGKLFDTANSAGDLDGLLVTFMWSLCRAPVDVFVMISGYFMITSQFDIKRTIKRASNVYGAMFFYSVAISVIFFIINPVNITVANCFIAVMPFFSKTWYFLSNYLIVLLLSPFLNKMLTSLTKKQYLYFMGIVFVVMSLWSTLAKVDGLDEVFKIDKIVDPYYGKSLGGFLLMYIIGGYLRLFVKQKPVSDGAKTGVKYIYLLAFFALCVADMGLYYLFPQYNHVFGMFNNPIVLAEGALLILFFRDFKFSSKLVNTIAGTTLGIYAIHENPYIREWLWDIVNFSDKALYDTLIYVPLAILACISIFACGCVIELVRLKIFGFFSNVFSPKENEKVKNNK